MAQMDKIKSPLSGICEDGTRVESWMETTWFDSPARLVRLHRIVRIISPDGRLSESDYLQQKHPVSTGEVHCGWMKPISRSSNPWEIRMAIPMLLDLGVPSSGPGIREYLSKDTRH
jgi:hypothetical protein